MKTLTSLFALLLVSSTLLAAATSQPAESQPAEKEKKGTLIGIATTKAGDPVKDAEVFIYIRKAAPGASLAKVAETKTNADGSFKLSLDPHDNYTINVLHKATNGVWANTGIKIKPAETTDLGTIKISQPRM